VWGRPPVLDLQAEATLHQLLRQLAKDGLIVGALDVSDGGLAVALARGCLQGKVGLDFGAAEDVFDETPACVVAVSEEYVGAVTKAINAAGGMILGMGVASGENFTVKGKEGVLISAPLSDLRTAHCSTLESQLAAEVVTG
jgi:phosphoribosylformylglycinamidine (FGAM) synthase-like enzyme